MRAATFEDSPRAEVTAELPSVAITGARPAMRETPVVEPFPPVPRARDRPLAPTGLRVLVTGMFVLLLIAIGGLMTEHLDPALFVRIANVEAEQHNGPRQTVPTTTTAPGRGTFATISSIQPSVGATGQTVVITGSDIVSPSGTIVARFGDEDAPTECPTETRCLATIPPKPPGTSSISVRLQVGSGISNAIDFVYR